MEKVHHDEDSLTYREAAMSFSVQYLVCDRLEMKRLSMRHLS